LAEVNIFNTKDAILLAAMCFQTYELFEKGKLILPKGFKLRYTIRAFADVENPTELVSVFLPSQKIKSL
jgi:triacylglycerol lipase